MIGACVAAEGRTDAADGMRQAAARKRNKRRKKKNRFQYHECMQGAGKRELHCVSMYQILTSVSYAFVLRCLLGELKQYSSTIAIFLL